MRNRFVSGDHNVISDISGQKFKRSECCFNWKGQLVHRLTEYEPKHPQIDIRGRQEKIAVTDGTRTQGDDLPLLNNPIGPSDLL
jgi:hypothetical protein